MSKILVAGNSPAALAAVQELRKLDASAEVELLCTDGALPYNRGLLPSLWTKDIKESQVYQAPESFYREHKVRVITDEVPVRLSTKRNHVATERKNHYNFDKLLLADMPHFKVPALKGHQKQGVFHTFTLSAVKACAAYMPFADTVIVPMTNFSGFNAACALKRLGKEVVLLAEGAGVLGEVFDEETASMLKQIVEGKGIRVVADRLEEILGDAEVKAVRLASGKVMAAEAVVFDTGSLDHKPLAESGLLDDQGRLITKGAFGTPAPNVFVCDAMTDGIDLSMETSMEQGRCAARVLMGAQDAGYQDPMPWRDFGRGICDGFCGGLVRLPEAGREHMVFDGPQNVFKKVFIMNDCLVGAVWFNAAGDRANVRQALARKMSLSGIEDQFLQSARI